MSQPDPTHLPPGSTSSYSDDEEDNSTRSLNLKQRPALGVRQANLPLTSAGHLAEDLSPTHHIAPHS